MKKLLDLWWLLLLLVIAAYPQFLGSKSAYQCGVLITVGVYVILAVSLDLLVGYAGQISVGHATFFAIGAYSSGIITTRYGAPPLVALLTGTILSAIVAWAVGRAVLALKEYYLAMATLALNEIVLTLLIGMQWLTGGASGLRDIPAFELFGYVFDDPSRFYYVVWVVVVLVVTASVAVVRSPFGRTLIAIHSDETAARTFGIDCADYKVRVYVLSAVFASLAGSLFAHYMGFLAPDDFGVLTSINLLVMLFLGGTGTIFGPAIGAAFLKLLPELTYQFQNYEILINGVILIIVLVFLPKGLFGTLRGVATRLAGKARA